ncbi:MAG TPA: gamma-glutamylcyclotransferase family protein [Steroidobacteraceae bacterium]|jgi:hypothetical protein|nr:gamma-glutamylcyclotransferase family protein [Steroidobacteraceae bacterium]
MGERRAEVFFYGLFMDADQLREKGIVPGAAEIAWAEGFALRIGKRAALVPDSTARAYGTVMSVALGDLERLYSGPGLEAYRPQTLRVQLASGGSLTAICYNLSQAPAADEHNPEYAAKLRAVASKVGLPAEYVASVR